MTARAVDTWTDLAPRIATSAGLVGTGAAAIVLGGLWFAGLIVVAVGLIGWEISVMAGARRPRTLGLLSAACCAGMLMFPGAWGLALLVVPGVAAQPGLQRAHLLHALFVALALLSGYALVALRGDAGPFWLIWLVLVVAVTDILGYFAGRLIGGRKFWPAVSPKKTWSGTVAGWAGAACVGLGAWMLAPVGPAIIALSVAVSMASQTGDIAQSAFKRHVGVKDSSNLLPGHGGVFDRFDGVLGASVFVLLIGQAGGFPPGIA